MSRWIGAQKYPDEPGQVDDPDEIRARLDVGFICPCQHVDIDTMLAELRRPLVYPPPIQDKALEEQ